MKANTPQEGEKQKRDLKEIVPKKTEPYTENELNWIARKKYPGLWLKNKEHNAKMGIDFITNLAERLDWLNLKPSEAEKKLAMIEGIAKKAGLANEEGFVELYNHGQFYTLAHFLVEHTGFANALAALSGKGVSFASYYAVLRNNGVLDFLNDPHPNVHWASRASSLKLRLLEFFQAAGNNKELIEIFQDQWVGSAFLKNPTSTTNELLEIGKWPKEKKNAFLHCIYEVHRVEGELPENWLGALKTYLMVVGNDVNAKYPPKGQSYDDGYYMGSWMNDAIIAAALKDPSKIANNVIKFTNAVGKFNMSEYTILNKMAPDFLRDADGAGRLAGGFIRKFPGNEKRAAKLLAYSERGYVLEGYKKNPSGTVSAISGAFRLDGKGNHDGSIATSKSFASKPEICMRLMKELGADYYWQISSALFANDSFSKKFEQYPGMMSTNINVFRKAMREKWEKWLPLLNAAPITSLLASDPKKAAEIVNAILARCRNADSYSLAVALTDSPALLSDFISGKAKGDEFFLKLKANRHYAIEAGRLLDEYHDRPAERMKYLATLSKEDVLSLLASDPVFFYTSTNNLLFDRLKSDFPGRTVSDTLRRFGLEKSAEEMNILFRAVNYGRLSGAADALFGMDELSGIVSKMLSRLDDKEVDVKYYYLIANSLRNFSNAGLGAQVAIHLKASMPKFEKKTDFADDQAKMRYLADARKYFACKFLINAIPNLDKIEKNCVFDAKRYSEGGRLNIVQVFSRNDTGKDHWGMSKAWFMKYGKPVEESEGKVVFEAQGARITLFMGKDEYENREFIESELKRNPRMVLTFRGHSYSLEQNVPTNIFKNNPNADILFIPGSCGSAGSIVSYKNDNPQSKILFVANTSTGKGQVTNALIDILVGEARKPRQRSFDEIIKKDENNARLILEQGGNPNSQKVTTVGEELLDYVNRQVAGL